MIRVAALAMVVVMIDGDSHVIPRDLLCLTTARGQPITLHLKGDAIFADGFESGGVASWRKQVEPCDG